MIESTLTTADDIVYHDIVYLKERIADGRSGRLELPYGRRVALSANMYAAKMFTVTPILRFFILY